MGVVMPEVLAAADVLAEAGVAVDVVCVTSADLLFRACRARRGLANGGDEILDELFPRSWPIVTALDGHPSALAFIGSTLGVSGSALGVTEFGQSGDVTSLYEHYMIDTETIVGTALDLIGAP